MASAVNLEQKSLDNERKRRKNPSDPNHGKPVTEVPRIRRITDLNQSGWQEIVDAWSEESGAPLQPFQAFVMARIGRSIERHFMPPKIEPLGFLRLIRRVTQVMLGCDEWIAAAKVFDVARAEAAENNATVSHLEHHPMVALRDQSLESEIAQQRWRYADAAISSRAAGHHAQGVVIYDRPGYSDNLQANELIIGMPAGSGDRPAARQFLSTGFVFRFYDRRVNTRFVVNTGIVDTNGKFWPVFDRNGRYHNNVVGVMFMRPGGSTKHSHTSAILYALDRYSHNLAEVDHWEVAPDGSILAEGRPLLMPNGKPAMIAIIGWDNPGHGFGASWKDFGRMEDVQTYNRAIEAYWGAPGRAPLEWTRSLGADYGAENAARGGAVYAHSTWMGLDHPRDWIMFSLDFLFNRFVGRDGQGAEIEPSGVTHIMQLFGLLGLDRTEAVTAAEVRTMIDRWKDDPVSFKPKTQFTFASDMDVRLGRMRDVAEPFVLPAESQLRRVGQGRDTWTLDEVLGRGGWATNWSAIAYFEPATYDAMQQYIRRVFAAAELQLPNNPATVMYGFCDHEYPQPDAYLFFQAFCAAYGYDGIFNFLAGHDHIDARRTSADVSMWSFSRDMQRLIQGIQAWRSRHDLEPLQYGAQQLLTA